MSSSLSLQAPGLSRETSGLSPRCISVRIVLGALDKKDENHHSDDISIICVVQPDHLCQRRTI